MIGSIKCGNAQVSSTLNIFLAQSELEACDLGEIVRRREQLSNPHTT
jgi:hypothetical protein